MKRIIPLLLVVLFAFILNACSGVGASKFTFISYDGVQTISDMEFYQSEVKQDGKNFDDPIENGVVNCPYYTLKVNGKEIPVYSTRCGEGVHSFAWIDVDEAETSIACGFEENMFLTVFVAALTGVGGGVMRDIMAGRVPTILHKRVYALAAIIGAVIYYLLICYTVCSSTVAVVIGAGSVLVIRILATIFRWNLPAVKNLDE